jgi:hypothetical protein
MCVCVCFVCLFVCLFVFWYLLWNVFVLFVFLFVCLFACFLVCHRFFFSALAAYSVRLSALLSSLTHSHSHTHTLSLYLPTSLPTYSPSASIFYLLTLLRPFSHSYDVEEHGIALIHLRTVELGLPSLIGVEHLCGIGTLQVLNLNFNNIRTIPEHISKLWKVGFSLSLSLSISLFAMDSLSRILLVFQTLAVLSSS